MVVSLFIHDPQFRKLRTGSENVGDAVGDVDGVDGIWDGDMVGFVGLSVGKNVGGLVGGAGADVVGLPEITVGDAEGVDVGDVEW